nr:uncharacterized protein LOC126525200 [Dermacentor andersoni]
MHFWKRLFFCVTWLPCVYSEACTGSCLVEWCPSTEDMLSNYSLSSEAIDPEADQNSCPISWCPSVKRSGKNEWICRGGIDPELLPEDPKTIEVTATLTEELPNQPPPQPPNAARPPGKKNVGSKGMDGIGLTESSQFVPYVSPDMSFPTVDCKKPEREGGPCLMKPDHHKITGPTKCYVGKCSKGKCTEAVERKCSTY